jgi:hypothetical protein
MNKFKVNEIVKIKKYPNPNDINHYGRIHYNIISILNETNQTKGVKHYEDVY